MKDQIKSLNAPLLTDKTSPWGVVSFIHKDSKEHTFYSVINEMTGDRLSAFDNDPPSVNDSMAWVKSVFRDKRTKAVMTGFGGTKHFM